MVKMQLRESERLKKELIAAHAQLKVKSEQKAEQLALKLAQIERQHAAALQRLFGSTSERRPRDKKPAARAPQKGHGPRRQPQLPTIEKLHELEENERVCDLCSKPMAKWEGQFEESEQIDFIAPKVVLERHRRQKYRCQCGGCIKTAAGPRKLFPGARYSINVALHVALQKYCYHRVPRRHSQPPSGRRRTSCCVVDEGRPLGIGVQAQVPNHLELLGSRVRVVSVEGKGVADPRQVRPRKASVSEPLTTCREVQIDVETGQSGRPGTSPAGACVLAGRRSA